MPSMGFRRALLAESKHKWATFKGMTGTTGRAVLSIGEKSRLSNNVGAVKHFLSVLLRALRRARHFALVEVFFAIPTKARS